MSPILTKQLGRSRQSNRELAETLGISERHLYRILQKGTSDPVKAAILSKTESIARRRPDNFCKTTRVNFREFAQSTFEPDIALSAEGRCLVQAAITHRLYEDFSTFEDFARFFSRRTETRSIAAAIPEVWDEFRIWCVQQAADTLSFAIELGDEHSGIESFVNSQVFNRLWAPERQSVHQFGEEMLRRRHFEDKPDLTESEYKLVRELTFSRLRGAKEISFHNFEELSDFFHSRFLTRGLSASFRDVWVRFRVFVIQRTAETVIFSIGMGEA